jgi:nucleotide-binding universal stress UspA family protein
MFKRLLVPLDGSLLAESAIPAAIYLSTKAGSSVVLLHIIEANAPEQIHGERHLTSAEEANAYLSEIQARCFPASIRVDCHVHTLETKNVARAIAEHLLELNQDTVVMSPHGRGGLYNALFGNIAQKAVALGSVPILLARGTGGDFVCRKILLPHDAVPEHEPALQAGIELACLTAAEVHQVMVIPTTATLGGAHAATGQILPRATRAILELAQQEGDAHLRRHVTEMQSKGLTVSSETVRGDPATCISQAADRFAADVIVLGTHGASGTKAFWEGSVAARVAAKSAASVLLCPCRR